MKKKVLFLCTGNSCRSQLAEALVNSRFNDQWEAYSAGSRPAGSVHPLAVKVLSEIDITCQGQPKSIDEFKHQQFDLIVTLCDDDDSQCPVWLGRGVQAHHPFPDPSRITGSEAKKMGAFRSVRDAIALEIPHWLARIQ